MASSASDRAIAMILLPLLLLAITVNGQGEYVLRDGDIRTGIIMESEVFEYEFEIDGDAFPESPFDMHVNLDVMSGDCDL